jgi:pimeloyl-ACP methyl ester carboxylesterase
VGLVGRLSARRLGRRAFLARSAALAGACWVATAGPAAAAARPARPVVLVHGYMDRVSTWQLAGNAVVARLTQVGYRLESGGLLPFVYPPSAERPDVEDSLADISLTGGALARQVQRAAAQSAAGQVDLIGFSMGGLVIRAALAELRAAAPAPLVNSAVLIATPNNGVDLLSLLSRLNAQAQQAIEDLARDLADLDLGSVAARQMLPASEFLQRLNEPRQADERVRYALVAGAAEAELELSRLRAVVPLGDGLISAPSATHLPGLPSSAYLLPERLGRGPLPPWQAVQESNVFHPRLLFNDDAALAAVCEIAPWVAELRAELESRLVSGRVTLASRA